jgi:hypothetical protein
LDGESWLSEGERTPATGWLSALARTVTRSLSRGKNTVKVMMSYYCRKERTVSLRKHKEELQVNKELE